MNNAPQGRKVKCSLRLRGRKSEVQRWDAEVSHVHSEFQADLHAAKQEAIWCMNVNHLHIFYFAWQTGGFNLELKTGSAPDNENMDF